MTVKIEVGADFHGVEQGGCGCPELGENLFGSGSGGHAVQVRDVGNDTVRWEFWGHIPPQGASQADGTTTSEREGRYMFVSPNDRSDGVVIITGGGYLLAQFITTRPIMDLCLEAERRPGSRVAKRWW